ncbi:MAG: hypothetical protein IT266_11945 [Saprospiraceae bacterium]|nr:hypothetical protein [Saprospiraceae bacterium]
MTGKSRVLAIYAIAGLLLIACRRDGAEKTPDVRNVEAKLELIRFDQACDPGSAEGPGIQLLRLCRGHEAFCELYFNTILGLQLPEDSAGVEAAVALDHFFNQEERKKTMAKVLSQLPDERELQDGFRRSLQYFKHYFPQEQEPAFYLAFCDFSYGNFIFSRESGGDGLGVGVEFFAGDAIDYRSIDPENPAFSDYLTRSFNKDHLVGKTWDAWLEDRIPVPATSRLIDFMLQRGKKLYILTKLLPDVADTALFDLPEAQLKWCRSNKVDIWSFFLNGKLLYSSELLKFNKYINPSPNSPGMPAEAPGRTGSYIGYEMVRSYMERNPEKQLSDLLEASDSQTFLQEARFKPRNE